MIKLFPFAGLLWAIAASGADPLDDWHWRVPSPQGNDLNSIARGNGVYVAVGMHATLLVSTNGVDWRVRSFEIPYRLAAVTFGNGRFVAVGDDLNEGGNRDYILISTNGIDWTDASLRNQEVLRLVVFGKGTFLTMGYDTPATTSTRLLTSGDGLQWTDQSQLQPPSVESVAFGAEIFAGVSGDGTLSSTNGLVWNSAVSPVRGIETVRFLNGRFVAVGHDDDYQNTGVDRPSFAFSTNGIDWISGSASDYSFYNTHTYVEVNGVGYANGRYVAVGSYASGVPAAWISTNAATWNLVPGSGLTAVPFDVLSEGDRLITVGRSGLIALSTNGTDWNQVAGPVEQTSWAMTHGNGLFVGVGAHGSVQTSSNGDHWSGQTVAPSYVLWGDVTFGSNRFVAVSRSGKAMTSMDGTNWAVSNTGFPLSGVTYGQGKFVAVGGYIFSSYGILRSLDGTNWTVVTSEAHDFDLWGVAYGNGLFVAAGSSGNILTSEDGNGWIRRTVLPNAYFRSVAFGNGVFVASGARLQSSLSFPVLYYSTNGTTWTEIPVFAFNPYFTLDRVTFGNGVFLALSARAGQVGGGQIFSSMDGIQWQLRHSPTMQDLTGAAADGATFVLTGPVGAILQSADMRPALRFERCCFDDAGIHQLTLRGGVSNTVYQTEFSDDLMHWTARWTNRVTGSDAIVFQGSAAFPQRFYRTQLAPP